MDPPMENTSRLKQRHRIVFTLVLATSLLFANFLINLATASERNSNPTFTSEMDDVVPVFATVLKISNVLTLGYVDRSQKRGHLVIYGKLSEQSSERSNLVDLILSLSGFGVLVFTSRKITSKILSNE